MSESNKFGPYNQTTFGGYNSDITFKWRHDLTKSWTSPMLKVYYVLQYKRKAQYFCQWPTTLLAFMYHLFLWKTVLIQRFVSSISSSTDCLRFPFTHTEKPQNRYPIYGVGVCMWNNNKLSTEVWVRVIESTSMTFRYRSILKICRNDCTLLWSPMDFRYANVSNKSNQIDNTFSIAKATDAKLSMGPIDILDVVFAVVATAAVVCCCCCFTMLLSCFDVKNVSGNFELWLLRDSFENSWN